MQDQDVKIIQRERCEKTYREAMQLGLTPELSAIFAARLKPQDLETTTFFELSLKHLDSPAVMKDAQKAAERLATAIQAGEVIGIETDHDCDGQTSHAVLHQGLIQYFGVKETLIRSYIGHRLKEGYGLSDSVCERILADTPKPTLVLTADNGSADEPRIARLKANGIDVIVTDHHEIPKTGIPQSAYACLNPTREDCAYSDPFIAGCMVAWLLLAATRRVLIERHVLPSDTPHLSGLLDFVAVGTVADCVSLARSKNNRVVIRYGLELIRRMQRPCWQAVKPLLNTPISAEDLGFVIGPLLNSDGRLSSAFGSVSFLLAKDNEDANAWVQHLSQQNQERKKIQRKISELGQTHAHAQQRQNRSSLVIFLEDGHPGVHGISASRFKDQYGKPTVFLAPKAGSETLVTGSARGIPGFHVKKAFEWIDKRYPDIFLAFGGHEGAGGLTLHTSKIQAFSKAFEEAACEMLDPQLLGPRLYVDGQLTAKHLTFQFIESLGLLEPFGREFEAPLFMSEASVEDIRLVGDNHQHARVFLRTKDAKFYAIWFNMRPNLEMPVPISAGSVIDGVFSLGTQWYRGEQQLNIKMIYAKRK